MNSALETARRVYAVLAEGWRLFLAGFAAVFPWVLMAELTQLLPWSSTGNIFSADLEQITEPGVLGPALLLGALQALLYASVVLRLSELTGDARRPLLWGSLRSGLSVLVGYLIYEVVVIIGLLVTLLVFVIGMLIAGPLAGFVLCVLPLWPTAAASTALAFFIFPAVLERHGPFGALGESSRLAKQSWLRASLVISVPAIVLLLLVCVENRLVILKLYDAFIALSARLEDLESMGGLSVDELQASLTSAISAANVTPGYGERLFDAVFAALCWWYTLAVCYAQYRDLKASDKV